MFPVNELSTAIDGLRGVVIVALLLIGAGAGVVALLMYREPKRK